MRLEKMLALSQAVIKKNLQLLINQSQDVFWVRNIDYTKQLYISPAYETVWGRTCESLYKYPEGWIDTVIPEDLQRIKEDVARRNPSVRVGDSFHQLYRIWIPSSAEFEHANAVIIEDEEQMLSESNRIIRWIDDQSFAIFDKGRHIGFAGIARDVTEKKRREAVLYQEKRRAEELSRAKTSFIENIQHDMRTPLVGIIGMSDLLTEMFKDKQGPYAEYSKMVSNAGRQLIHFLNDILDLLTKEAVGFQQKPSPFDLFELVNSVVDMFNPAMKNKNLGFDLQVDDQIPQYLIGNREGLFRILLNLMSNAVKFTECGSICLNLLSASGVSDEDFVLKISISDTGIGIPEDKKGVIFEKLTRLIPSQDNKYPGTGLGLHMVKEYVHAMDGAIEVYSVLGKGTEFIVTLPLKKGAKAV